MDQAAIPIIEECRQLAKEQEISHMRERQGRRDATEFIAGAIVNAINPGSGTSPDVGSGGGVPIRQATARPTQYRYLCPLNA